LRRSRLVGSRKKGGQILLAVAVVISVLLMSAAVLSYVTSVSYRKFSDQPYPEVITAIASDYGNFLVNLLADFTHTYNSTSDINGARQRANQLHSTWILASTSAFAGRGVVIGPEWTSSQIQPPKTLYGYCYPTRLAYNLTKLYWYQPQSISAVGSSISIDMPAAGFYGFKTSFLALLNLTIDVPSIQRDQGHGTVSFRLRVLKEEQKPLFDLTSDNFQVRFFDPTATPADPSWRVAGISSVEYEGQGSYFLTVKPVFKVPSAAVSFWSLHYKYFDVIAVDSRDILVEACSYCGLEMQVRDSTGITTSPGNHCVDYVFEMLSNATAFWFGRKIQQPACPPLPPIPGRQLSVQVEWEVGGTPTIEIVVAQVEQWEPTQRFPSAENEGSPSRFLSQSRLVFDVGYPPGITDLVLTVSWEPDCDIARACDAFTAREEGPTITIDNGHFSASLLNTTSPSEWQNYTMSVTENGSTFEYSLGGYDSASVNGSLLLPRKVPCGTWTVIAGPVRALAFRRSSAVMDRLSMTVTTSEALHETVIAIPMGEDYFYWQMNLTWKIAVQLSNKFLRIYSVATPNGTDFGSLLKSDRVTIVNGTFAGAAMEHRDRRYNLGQDFSNWAAIYSNSLGAALIAPGSTLSELGASGEAQLWAWTSSVAQRVFEYDLYYFRTPPIPFTVDPNHRIVTRGAGFVYGGGLAQSPYQNDQEWRIYPVAPAMHSSSGISTPNTYQRMFLEERAPAILSIQPF